MSKEQRDAIDAALRAAPFDLEQSVEEHRKTFDGFALQPYPADVSASGFNPVLLHGAVPDRDVLDRVSGGRPVWIKHASGHSCQLNGEGLRLTGVLDHLGDSVDGGRIVLDSAAFSPTARAAS